MACALSIAKDPTQGLSERSPLRVAYKTAAMPVNLLPICSIFTQLAVSIGGFHLITWQEF